ncbi:MAG TPA: CoA ester lyase [Gemmatimonadaceae bacterium]|nr:CoA ester lyase [Gemmatimonadaceae bacterium]
MNFPKSLLFVPANRIGMFPRAWESEAEAVIFDLEDSVLPANKAEAREVMAKASPPASWKRPVFVRVNPYGTDDFEHDLSAAHISAISFAGVILPKVERVADVREAEKLVTVYEKTDKPLAMVLLIETPRGVTRAVELADCGVKRVAALAFGAEDYRAGMGVDVLDPALADFARSTVSNAAAAAGMHAIEAPMLKFDDPDRLRMTARHARALGFKSMFAIHPAQVTAINEEFGAGADRAWALRAVDAYERAARDGHGSAALDGQMIDEATMKRARDILKS